MKVIVVGAGMSGLIAARRLVETGHEVVVLDKGRGVGGRMATRRMAGAVLDHGAQFFTAASREFRAVVAEWKAAGWVAVWHDGVPPYPAVDGRPRYVAPGGMTQLAKNLAEGLDVRLDERVSAIRVVGDGVDLDTEKGLSLFADRLVLTSPVPQSIDVLEASGVAVPEALRAVEFERCLGLLVVLDGPGSVPLPGGYAGDSQPLGWIADNHRKGISEVPALTLHASADWSLEHYEAEDAVVREALLEAGRPWIGDAGIVESQVKRWKFCRPSKGIEAPVLVDGPLTFAGDAFAASAGEPRLERAFLSGWTAGG